MPGVELFGIEEKKEVNDVLETGILFRYNHDAERKGIWKSKAIEDELCSFTGAKHAHFVTSGSSAVFTALTACGIGYGDEVIVPPFTYIATIEAVIYAGAIPVFAEIDETICLSPEGVKAVINPNTKAVLMVHMCGAIGKIEEIMTLCKAHNLTFIEDSAQALGAFYKGRAAGTFGSMGCYSFDFFKIVTAGEGGAVVTNDEQLYKNADMLADHGHDHIGNARGMEQHPVLGTNFRTSELHAAVGLAQLRKIKYILQKQKEHFKIVKETLSKYPQITFRYMPDPEGDSCTFICFFLPDEETTRKVVKGFAEEKIDGCQYWYDNNFHYYRNWEHLRSLKSTNKLPLHVLPKSQNYETLQFPQSDKVMQRLISAVIKVNWTEEELKARLQKMDTVLKKVLG